MDLQLAGTGNQAPYGSDGGSQKAKNATSGTNAFRKRCSRCRPAVVYGPRDARGGISVYGLARHGLRWPEEIMAEHLTVALARIYAVDPRNARFSARLLVPGGIVRGLRLHPTQFICGVMSRNAHQRWCGGFADRERHDQRWLMDDDEQIKVEAVREALPPCAVDPVEGLVKQITCRSKIAALTHLLAIDAAERALLSARPAIPESEKQNI